MAEELRQLHLLGALGASRVEMCGGKEWLVVPTVALMEGVIHPVNAKTPEFVSAAVLEKAAASWNGKPITIGHPVKNGMQCSANDDAIRETHHIGEVRHARFADKKLLCESWIDIARAEKMHPTMLAALRADKPQEVSVGAFVHTDEKPGAFGDKPYKAAWLETKGDHLAFLYGGRGACSQTMGCGTHRAAMHLMTAEAIETDPLEIFALQVLATKYADCKTCNGTGQVKDGDSQQDCPTCDGAGEIRAAAGARHNTEDVTLIQAVHDHAAALGATCDRANYKLMEEKVEAAAITPELKAACRCEGESTMTKEKKAELIAALTTDKYSGFKDTDVAFLETATDARLEEFKAAADTNKTAAENATKQENDLRAAQAKLTVIENKLKAAEQAPTAEQWLAQAPPEIKTLLENQKAQETETREALIKELKTAGANTEDELKAMPTAQLQTLAKYAKVVAPDFSGRGIPQQRAAAANDLSAYAPPDPYAAELKTLREKTVN